MLVQPLRKSKEEETFAAKTGRYDQAWAVPIPDCYLVNDCALHHEEVQPSHLLGDAFRSEVVDAAPSQSPMILSPRTPSARWLQMFKTKYVYFHFDFAEGQSIKVPSKSY